MKKYLIIILVLLVQVIQAANNRFEKQERFFYKTFQNNNALSVGFVHKPSALTHERKVGCFTSTLSYPPCGEYYPVACRRDKKLVLPYADKLKSGEGWNLFDINILGMMEGYVNPEAFFTLSVFLNINSISEWDSWDGWLKHVITGTSQGFYYRYNYRLNSTGSLLEYIQEYKEDDVSDWVNEINMTFEYNTNNKISGQLLQVWDSTNSMWQSYVKVSFSYDVNTRLTEAVTFEWCPDSNTWAEYGKNAYTYDGAGNVIKTNRYLKNQDVWEEFSRNEFSYTSGKISEYKNYDYDLPEFSQKITFNYNTSNKVLSYTGYSLNPIDSSWLPESHYVVSYNTSGDYSDIIIQEMDTLTGAWVNYLKDIFNYNSDKNMIEEIALLWDDGANDWVNAFKLVYAYNTRKNPAAYSGYEWNELAGQWESSGDSATIVYEYTNSIIPNNQIASLGNLMQVKHMNGALKVSVKGVPANNDIMAVYDLQGRMVYSSKPVCAENNAVYTWEVSGMNKAPAKVYVLCIQRNDCMITQRIIINK